MGFKFIIRTDERGQYVIKEEPDDNFGAVFAFAKDRLPVSIRVDLMKKTGNTEQTVPDLHLYPAARVRVHLDPSSTP